MQVNLRDLTGYIDLLEERGLFITLHGEIINNPQLVRFNFHQNPYCVHIKMREQLWPECVRNQSRVFLRCRGGEFFGCCHAGVSEFIYPVTVEREPVGFVSVSGFIDEGSPAEQKLRHLCEKKNISFEALQALRMKHLSSEIPSTELLDILIHPLILMLEQYYLQNSRSNKNESDLYRRMLHFISENIHGKLSMQMIAEHFNYSVSTVSRFFIKNCGKSLPRYITELRLEEAKWILRNTDTPVTETALFLGFCNANYFSTVFKEHTGVSPKQFQSLRRRAAGSDRSASTELEMR